MPPLQPLRILLVEDNHQPESGLADAGRRKAISSSPSNNGREAFETLAGQDFDAVLMDVQMPEMDGLEATAAIRASEEGRTAIIPILALTAHALAATANTASTPAWTATLPSRSRRRNCCRRWRTCWRVLDRRGRPGRVSIRSLPIFAESA